MQLLVCLDGFEGRGEVITIASTNRPDILDPALVRPGRFDRKIYIPKPGLIGRMEILQVSLPVICDSAIFNVYFRPLQHQSLRNFCSRFLYLDTVFNITI